MRDFLLDWVFPVLWIFLFVGVASAQEGFYLSIYKTTQYEESYREVTGTEEVPIYDELGQNIIGYRTVPTYKPVIDKWSETKPDLPFIPNGWIDMGEHDGKVIFYCLGRQDPKSLLYLGADLSKFADTKMWKPMLLNRWGEKESGTLDDWIEAGKPTLLDEWQPRCSFGQFKMPPPQDIENVSVTAIEP